AHLCASGGGFHRRHRQRQTRDARFPRRVSDPARLRRGAGVGEEREVDGGGEGTIDVSRQLECTTYGASRRRGARTRMNVLDFDGQCQVEDEEHLLARLRSVRRGADAAFILDHGGDESLWIHINGGAAFLWFCPGTDPPHAGFVPNEMWPGERRDVRFQLVP